jgi:two-component system OmpR family response regulator
MLLIRPASAGSPATGVKCLVTSCLLRLPVRTWPGLTPSLHFPAMEKSPHLLLIEDDAEISVMVSRFMTDHGFRVTRSPDGRMIDRIMAAGRVDFVVLDVMLPGEDGLSICRRLRAQSGVPILMLTALGSETDRIVGLEMGADDYLPKPFSPRELLARVRAVLRRGTMSEPSPGALGGAGRPLSFTFDDWRIDLATRQLYSPDGLRMALTSGEFNLLSVFCQHAGQVLSRDQLLDLLHGRAAAMFDRSVDIQVSRLRRKIEPDPKDPTMIKTVRYGGYMFTPVVTVTTAMQ